MNCYGFADVQYPRHTLLSLSAAIALCLQHTSPVIEMSDTLYSLDLMEQVYSVGSRHVLDRQRGMTLIPQASSGLYWVQWVMYPLAI